MITQSFVSVNSDSQHEIMNFSIIILFIHLAFASATHTNFENCRKPHELSSDDCDIHELSIDPCLKSSTLGICAVEMNSNIRIVMNHTPKFEGTMHHNIYRVKDGGMDYPIYLPSSICGVRSEFTLCYYLSGLTVNTTIDWTLPADLSAGNEHFYIKLWNNKQNTCCAAFTLNVLPMLN